jgi:hypothetical protein
VDKEVVDESEKTPAEERWNIAINRLDPSHFNYIDEN